jgi:hypothetical protein
VGPDVLATLITALGWIALVAIVALILGSLLRRR